MHAIHTAPVLLHVLIRCLGFSSEGNGIDAFYEKSGIKDNSFLPKIRCYIQICTEKHPSHKKENKFTSILRRKELSKLILSCHIRASVKTYVNIVNFYIKYFLFFILHIPTFRNFWVTLVFS